MTEILDWNNISKDTIIGKLIIGESLRKGSRNKIHYRVVCSCGRIEESAATTLKKGKIECFCCALKNNSNRLLHGFSKTRLHNIWWGMHARCYDINAKRFQTWGGRGITICDEWKNNFLAFREWALNNGYQDNLSIDRIDNDGNYEPKNCRWATNIEQCNNTRNTKRVTIDGTTKTIIEWAKESPVSRSTIFQRIFKYSIDPKIAVFSAITPKKEKYTKAK